MELDEFKTAWQQMDRKLSATMALQQDMRREIRMDRARKSLTKFMFLPIFELIAGLITAVPSATFLVRNLDHATFAGHFFPAVMFLLGALTVGLSVWQLDLIVYLDYSKPVIEIQRRLAKITRLRIESAAWLIALLTPLWFAFPIALVQILAGRAGYRELSVKLAEFLSSGWFVGNLLVGLGLVMVAFGIYRWKGSTVEWTKVLSENSLRAASEHLDEIDRFEKES